MREPELCWCSLIWVWGTQNDSYAKELNALPCFIRPMVGSSVEKYYDSFSPPSPILLRESWCKLRQKHHHDVLVRVALSQWKPNGTFRWNRADHVDFVSKTLLWQRVVLVRLIPAMRTKVADGYPTLVDVNDVRTFWIDLEHFTSVEMSKNSILFRVANVCDPLHTTVAEAELLLQNSDNCSKRYLRSSVFARFKLDLLSVPDTLPSLACRMNCTDDTCLFCFLLQFRLSFLHEKTPTLFQVLEQVVNSLHLDIE